jgi:hypothetical protein
MRLVIGGGTSVQWAALGEVGVWRPLLTEDEGERAREITNDVLRARFVVSRGLRRKVLADCVGRSAGDLEFVEAGESKPRLVGGEGWDFIGSHAGDYVVVVAGRVGRSMVSGEDREGERRCRVFVCMKAKKKLHSLFPVLYTLYGCGGRLR